MKNESKILSLIERHRESGLTVHAFCANEGIAPATFYNWKKKLRDNNEKRFIPLVVKTTQEITGVKKPDWQEENNIYKQQGSGHLLEITYPNGISLRIKSDLDLSHLKALIKLLD